MTTVTYSLSVNGTGGTNFSETKYVRFMEKGFSIYIQTDKAVYKPGQKGNLAYYTPLWFAPRSKKLFGLVMAITSCMVNSVIIFLRGLLNSVAFREESYEY